MLPSPLLIVGLFLSAPTALAGEADSAPIRGLAGAGVANPTDGNAIRRSPAAMLLEVGYTLQTDARYADGIGLTTAIKDTRTSDFGAGLLYSREWVTRTPTDDQLPGWVVPGEDQVMDVRGENAFRLGAGYGFGRVQVAGSEGSYEVRRFAVGASVIHERDTSSLDGISSGTDLDLSVAGRPKLPLSLALTVHDILPTSDRELSSEIGAWYTPHPMVALAADFVYDPAFGDVPWGGRAGTEILLGGVVPARIGYAVLGSSGQHLGFGLGAQSTTATLNYAMTVYTVGPLAGQLEHSLGLRASF